MFYSRTIFVFILTSLLAQAQSLGGAGKVDGTIEDPSSAVIAGAQVTITNRITGYTRSASTDSAGAFRFTQVPPNSYRLEVTAPGFNPVAQDLIVRSSVPVVLKLSMAIAGGQTVVNVEGSGADMIENVPYAHGDLDRSLFVRLPAGSPASSLSDAILFASPGVAADSNGFFHPLGDHAQVTFSIDGQPISDQQSKQFSTQIPLNAIQSMEVISGAPPVEFGDKTSLVVSAITRSGIGQKPTGSFTTSYGSFGSVSEETTFAAGGPRIGNFLSASATRSGRFLDTPEFHPIHAAGNNENIFDHLDFNTSPKDAFHLNLFAARNWFQVPNTYDQPEQDQRQKVITTNIAPGYQRTINAHTLATANLFVRRDQVRYYPSRDPFADLPATLGQHRTLTNWGIRSDVAAVRGRHDLKIGVMAMQTRLGEHFALGITDPDFVDPVEQPGLVPFDLTRGGSPLVFDGRRNVNQVAVFAQDSFTWRSLNVTGGVRIDRYAGLSSATGVQPRAGAAYHVRRTDSVLRAAYSRTMETPYNENLVFSSAAGAGGLAANVFGAYESRPIEPGRRNQFNAGFQQNLGRVLQVDGDYFWKFTRNAFDFGALFNTPIQFPISWAKSKIDGFALRVSTTNLRGFLLSTTMGHSRARFFGPSQGGLIFNSPLDTGVFRIDHDQAFQQSTVARYQRPRNGAWMAFTWRYDSGLVAGAVPDLEAVAELTPAQQAAIAGGRVRIPAPGTFDPDHNPARIAPRNVFDLGAGTDNLFRKERMRATLKLTVVNLTNTVALYNFLSTFSGTHFVTPRAYRAELGFVF
jgi:hypothetical protein